MKIYSSIFLLLLSLLIYSQVNPKTKWDDISQAEIDYKEVPFEKDADTVIIYESGEIIIRYADWDNTIHRRIKILTQQRKQKVNYNLIYSIEFSLKNTYIEKIL